MAADTTHWPENPELDTTMQFQLTVIEYNIEWPGTTLGKSGTMIGKSGTIGTTKGTTIGTIIWTTIGKLINSFISCMGIELHNMDNSWIIPVTAL